MATTFLTLYTAALRASQSSADDATALAIAKSAVNEAYLSVCGDGNPWDFLQAGGQWQTQAGADTYTLANIASGIGITGGSIKEVIHLTDDTHGGRPIPSMAWGELESLAAGTDYAKGVGIAGAPTAWARFGDRLRLYPTPSAVYDIGTFFTIAPAALVSDSDSVLIPDAYATAVLVPYAGAILLETEGGPEALSARNALIDRHERNYLRLRTSHGSAKPPTFTLVTPTATADWDVLDDITGWAI